MILRPLCWLLGHKRGKLILSKTLVRNKDKTYSEARYFRCPRCNGNERRYKVKSASRVGEEDELRKPGFSSDQEEDHRLDDPRYGQAKVLNRKYE